MFKIILSCWNFIWYLWEIEIIMGLKKKDVYCVIIGIWLFIYVYFIFCIGLVCRYFFRYIILSVKYWVFCDKNKG